METNFTGVGGDDNAGDDRYCREIWEFAGVVAVEMVAGIKKKSGGLSSRDLGQHKVLMERWILI